MSKLKKKLSGKFTQVSNIVFDDWRLSYKEVGLYCQMLRFPQDWDFSIRMLAKYHEDKKLSVTSGLDKLIEYGYVTRKETQARKGNGKFGSYDYTIYEDPFDNPEYIPCPPRNSESAGNPCAENQTTVSPQAENRTTVITGVENQVTETTVSENQTTVKPQAENQVTVPQADYPLAENPRTGNQDKYKTISTNTVSTNTVFEEEEDVYAVNDTILDTDHLRQALMNKYLSIFFSLKGNQKAEEELNHAFHALINTASDIKDPEIINALNHITTLQASDLLGWIYDNLYSTRIGCVYRKDINDKYSYIRKVIIRRMKTESGDDPLQSFGIM